MVCLDRNGNSFLCEYSEIEYKNYFVSKMPKFHDDFILK